MRNTHFAGPHHWSNAALGGVSHLLGEDREELLHFSKPFHCGVVAKLETPSRLTVLYCIGSSPMRSKCHRAERHGISGGFVEEIGV
mmetsp:Transcript_76923/g.141298  ORF Transcript_76923/g.141298 Transcript_76923/m.141298 type:complete len:86 (-) Transcript_76923:219-476(-)